MANLGYLQLVRHCNQHCRFCSNPEVPSSLSFAQAEAALDDLATRGYWGVILTGGEPTLSELAPKVVAAALRRGLQVRMISNGLRLSDADYAASLTHVGLSHVHLSLHSSRQRVQDFLTGKEGSQARLWQALGNLHGLGATIDINTVINHYNADHLDETVMYVRKHFPFVRHFVWNALDPSMGRAMVNRDTAPYLAEFEGSLHKALFFLNREGCTFRVERVPLCYMTEFAYASTETRKIVLGEERFVYFLDEKGAFHQTDFHYQKAECCQVCSLESICAGLFDGGDWYDRRELFPVFVEKESIVARIRAV